jgi:hypothetical protein
VARNALSGFVFPRVGSATHYHANYVVPSWAAQLTRLTQIGAHIFYSWGGRGGLPGAVSHQIFGIHATNNGVVGISGDYIIVNNGTGLLADTGSQIVSARNNWVNGNTTDGAPTSTPGPK